MIVTMIARYESVHHDEAVAKATAIWRDFIGDPDAELPWDANLRIELGTDRTEDAAGRTVAERPHGEAVLTVKVPNPRD